MRRKTFFASAASALSLIAATPTLAQEAGQSEAQSPSEDGVEVLSTWSYDPLYEEGWSVETMFDQTQVLAEDGGAIGDVENVIFGDGGEVLSIIAQVGGVWDIGDTHVNVPWSEVSFDGGIAQVTVPVTEDTVDDYDVFGGLFGGEEQVTRSETDATGAVEDDLAAGPDVFKATDLIGDYAYLSDGARYGYLSDLLIRDDRIAAVVADAGAYGRRGYYAYPYTYRSDMMGPRYDMRYDSGQIDTIESFDYDRLQSRATQ
jgi:sporulation protein YlmC with PRC-barrel domain